MAIQAVKENEISLIDAVETLSNIADMDLDREMGITEDHELKIQEQRLIYRTVHWLNEQNADHSIELITDKFRNVLDYLRNFYSKEYTLVKDPKAADGIKTIMVLVGEAAKKLDKYTAMFHHIQAQSALDLKEYRQLQEFYLSKIARTIDEGILGKWILALSQRTLKKRKPTDTKPPPVLKGHKHPITKHIFVDLESVKKDTEYELFFLRKEDGSRFFSPRLVRNIKLVCDFGNYFRETKTDDPLHDMELILDRYIQSSAKSLFRTLHSVINRFYREGLIYRQNELVEGINKTIMSLMLSSNPSNLKKNDPTKCCTEYFYDFQRFLREITQSRDYQKLTQYGPDKGSTFARCLLETVQAISCGFVTSMQGFVEVSPVIGRWLEEARSEDMETQKHSSDSLVDHLRNDYAIMSKFIKKHPNGPLIKVLESLERGTYHFFDPCWQNNLPSQLYSLYLNDQRMMCLHLPSPTYQEFINKASVNEEFKAMLGALSSNYMLMSKFLLINLQDRTSWKEHFRCAVLEELQRMHQYESNLTVVTINHDTEFYNQLSPYNEDNQVELFMDHFMSHLYDESSGFYYPKEIKKALFPDFVSNLMHSIHKVFFGTKNVLSRDRRMDFIQIFYLFLELKIIELVKPDAFSLTCKDGIDCGSTNNSLLFCFMKLLSNEPMLESDYDLLNVILYGPALIVRERAIMPERFNRMLSALKVIENTRDELGKNKFRESIENIFKKHFKLSFLDSRIALPKAA